MKRSDLQIGFELEFGCNLTPKNINKGVKSLFKNGPFPDARAAAAKHAWDVKSDGSIRTAFSDEVEIATPVYQHATGMKALRTLFDYMDTIDAEVNHSCGLHVSIGFPDKILGKKIDPVKAVMLTDEEKWLRVFARSRNNHCRITREGFGRIWTEHKDWPIDRVIRQWNWGFRNKYNAVNTTKVSRHGFVEFRIPGNRKYHHRYDEIAEAIYHFSDSVLDSVTTRRDNVVLKELARIKEMAA